VTPIDVTTTKGRLTLTSNVWPDQPARLERLRGAFRVAQELPAEVRRQDAASFVGDLALVEATTTVLWHSVMWPAGERRVLGTSVGHGVPTTWE